MTRLALCFVFALSLLAPEAGFAARPGKSVKKGPGFKMKTHTKKKPKVTKMSNLPHSLVQDTYKENFLGTINLSIQKSS